MVSDARHVYWSKDHGRTMKDRFQTMAKLVDAKFGSEHDRLASVSQIIVNAGDPKKVLLWGDGNVSFSSKDGGETLTLVDNPSDTLGLSHKIRQHPTQPDWLLSIAYRQSCYLSGKGGCAMDLWVSKDFGNSWTNLTEASGGKLAGVWHARKYLRAHAHARIGLKLTCVQTTPRLHLSASLSLGAEHGKQD